MDSRATWDGVNWAEAGSGTQESPGALHSIVDAFAVFDDGSGERLYSAATYAYAVYRVGRWDGSIWTRLGIDAARRIRALVLFDDGSGSALIATGASGFMGKWAYPLGLFADYCNGDGGDQLGCTDAMIRSGSACEGATRRKRLRSYSSLDRLRSA